jgi:hypothetical protein
MALADVMSITKWSIAFICRARCGKGGIPLPHDPLPHPSPLPTTHKERPNPARPGFGSGQTTDRVRRCAISIRRRARSIVAACPASPSTWARAAQRRLGAAAVASLQVGETRVDELEAAAQRCLKLVGRGRCMERVFPGADVVPRSCRPSAARAPCRRQRQRARARSLQARAFADRRTR